MLAIREHGLPLDASVESRPAQPEPSSRAWRDVHHAVDEVHWQSLGKDGTELVLAVQRPQADVADHLPEAELARQPADAPRAPQQQYTIRRMRPEEAISVPDGDVLRLQYLSVPLDPGRLQVASPFGEEIVGYAAKERARVDAGRRAGRS